MRMPTINEVFKIKEKPAFPVERVFRHTESDHGSNTVRVNPNLMKENGFVRNQLVAIVNKDTGAMAFGTVAGQGKEYRLFPTTIALSYDTQVKLGVNTRDKFNLEVRIPSLREQHIFVAQHHQHMSLIRAKVQFWCIPFGVFGSVIGVIGSLYGFLS